MTVKFAKELSKSGRDRFIAGPMMHKLCIEEPGGPGFKSEAAGKRAEWPHETALDICFRKVQERKSELLPER